MTFPTCPLPAEHFHFGTYHARIDVAGRVERYERCPARMAADVCLTRAGVPERYRSYTKATFPVEWPTEAAAFLADPMGNVYIFGSNGTGKTHLATAMLGELLATGKSGAWCSAKLLPNLDPERNDKHREEIERYEAVDVLVMDDLWSEGGGYKVRIVRDVAERRYLRARVTLFTSMVPPEATPEERERGIKGALELDSDLASRACSGVRIERAGIDQRFMKTAQRRA